MKTTRFPLLLCILALNAMPSFSGGQSERIRLNCGNGASLEMSRIPAGTFMMGSPASDAWRRHDEVRHQATISKMFYMGIHEVTQAEYEAVMGGNPSYFKGRDLPVESVSWYDAMEFCRRLSEKTGRKVRLPTEAEWEYACRAGTTTPFHFGETLPERVNFESGYGSWRTQKAGDSPANDWGLRDMHGNVREWCSDLHGEYPEDEVADPKGASIGANRVARGGSWDDLQGCCRSACRGSAEPGSRNSYQGFRVCLEPESGIAPAGAPENGEFAAPPREPAKHPLPIHGEHLHFERLREKGIVSATRDLNSRRILVSREDEKKAILALAEKDLLKNYFLGEEDRNERRLFRTMLRQWAFPDSDAGKRSDEFTEQAYAGEMARLIECMDDIAEAHVTYFEDERKTLFGPPRKAVAIIRVETRHQKPLPGKTVDAIASIAATDPRLDRRDVVVIDQMGNKFRPGPSRNSLSRRWKAEFALDEQLRPMIEKLVRTWYGIPGGHDQCREFDVNVFPAHTLDFSGEDAFIDRMAHKHVRRRPREDTGEPKKNRHADLQKMLWRELGYIIPNTMYYDGGKEDIVRPPPRIALPEPSVKDLTLAVVIHLPCRIKRDGDGRALELESIEPLSLERIEALSRQILQASGMALADVHEKLWIVQEH